MAYERNRIFTNPTLQNPRGRFGMGKAGFVGGVIGTSLAPASFGLLSTIGMGGAGAVIGAGIYGTSYAITSARQLYQDILRSRGADTSSRFIDTRASFTMRQATLQAMHDSAFNARSVIGNEASLMHR